MSEHNLKSLQAFFQSAIAGGETLSESETNEIIHSSSRLNAVSHLAIYRRGYYARLLECLGKQFSVLRMTLGEELFREFALEYLSEYPSQSYTLNDLGSRFAVFLENSRPDQDETEKEEWIDFMIDLARFEWVLFAQFDRPGHEGKAYAALTDTDDDLRLQPCFELIRFSFPIAGYYRLASTGTLPDHPPAKRTYVALVRTNFITGIFELKPAAFDFLFSMQSGKNVAESLKTAAEANGISEEEIRNGWNKWRTEWIKAGFFINAHL